MDGEPIIIDAVSGTDIVLIVGPGKEQIPAVSAILKAASPVFAAMLSPPWLESNSKEISLPDDDADAMRFITLALSYHNENEIVTRPRVPMEILNIAMAVEKYDLCMALKFVLDYLLRQAIESFEPVVSEGADDIVYLCAAAYVLDRCEYFSKGALDLMCSHVASFTTFMDDEYLRTILPAQFFVRLAEKLPIFQLGVFRAIQTCVKEGSFYRTACHCSRNRSLCKRYEEFALKLIALKLGPVMEDDDGFGLRSGLFSVLHTFRGLLQEDSSFINGECEEKKGIRHSDLIPNNNRFRHKVERVELISFHFCIRELKTGSGVGCEA
ncbi:hypothetical protein QBC45DRAFT_338420 [Copromyces sp. CBS 386.78]|nr:hypothetical protein QBC45DRAFT_338420 [Copromyces sp. CBS 386.78]